MRRRPSCVKLHLAGIVEEKVLADAAAEVALPVGADSHNARLVATVSPCLPSLVESVDAVCREPPEVEGKANYGQWFELLVQPPASVGHRASRPRLSA